MEEQSLKLFELTSKNHDKDKVSHVNDQVWENSETGIRSLEDEVGEEQSCQIAGPQHKLEHCTG